jgi:NAD(P)-dependent dehydrogenase (short-subunit alcohol dehydrogenase family)
MVCFSKAIYHTIAIRLTFCFLGIETQFATNHVAHFYLTTLLLPELQRSTPSRVVNVSSDGHRSTFGGKLDLENISNPAKYGRFGHYSKSKVLIVIFWKLILI